MSEFFEIMLVPLLACMLLSGIHVYLGLHVIERGVIFVDLALAQLAALGATFAVLYGYSLHSWQSYLFSVTLTLLGAALLAFSRLRSQRVPQEALIGIVYAVAGAASILALSGSPEGGEELKALLVGHILFLSTKELFQLLILYSLVGAVLWRMHGRLLLISTAPKDAAARGLRVQWWDFLFYGLFGIVVTSSVEVAGVLLVFTLLIVPSVVAAHSCAGLGTRLLAAWGVGTITSAVGVLVSYTADLPTGATIVCVFGLVALLALLFVPAAVDR